MAGLYFDQFEVGQSFDHEIRRTVTDMDNMMFSSLTYNPAAIHIDHDYCSRTEFGRPLMNSIFTLGLVIGLSVQDTTLGTTIANLGMTDTTFPQAGLCGRHHPLAHNGIGKARKQVAPHPGHYPVRTSRPQPA